MLSRCALEVRDAITRQRALRRTLTARPGQGRPVPYSTFRTYMLQVLGEIDPELSAQDSREQSLTIVKLLLLLLLMIIMIIIIIIAMIIMMMIMITTMMIILILLM